MCNLAMLCKYDFILFVSMVINEAVIIFYYLLKRVVVHFSHLTTFISSIISKIEK